MEGPRSSNSLKRVFRVGGDDGTIGLAAPVVAWANPRTAHPRPRETVAVTAQRKIAIVGRGWCRWPACGHQPVENSIERRGICPSSCIVTV